MPSKTGKENVRQMEEDVRCQRWCTSIRLVRTQLELPYLLKGGRRSIKFAANTTYSFWRTTLTVLWISPMSLYLPSFPWILKEEFWGLIHCPKYLALEWGWDGWLGRSLSSKTLNCTYKVPICTPVLFLR